MRNPAVERRSRRLRPLQLLLQVPAQLLKPAEGGGRSLMAWAQEKLGMGQSLTRNWTAGFGPCFHRVPFGGYPIFGPQPIHY